MKKQRKLQSKIEFKDTPTEFNILKDVEDARKSIKTGTITVIPSLYASDEISVLFVSLKNFNKLKSSL